MGTERRAAGRRAERLQWRGVFDQRILKSFGSPLREKIMWILNERDASPSEIADELGEPLNRVSYDIGVLRKAECVELVERRIVGGAVEHIYRANTRFILDELEWPEIADSVRQGMRGTLLRAVVDDAVAVVSAGTYDLLPKSHMSCVPFVVDDQGREDVAAILKTALEGILDVQEQSRERLGAAGEKGQPYTVSILGYPAMHEGECKSASDAPPEEQAD